MQAPILKKKRIYAIIAIRNSRNVRRVQVLLSVQFKVSSTFDSDFMCRLTVMGWIVYPVFGKSPAI